MSYIVEVAEDGTLTLPAEALDHAEPHTRYVIEKNNGHFVLRTKPPLERPKMTGEEWLAMADDLAKRMSESIPGGKSLVEELIESRR